MILNKTYLRLKYVFSMYNPCKVTLHRLENDSKRKSWDCSKRAQTLYLELLKKNHSPKIIRCELKDNNEIAPFNKLFQHISGKKFGYHDVVECDGYIFDPDLRFGKPVHVSDFRKFVIKYSNKNELLFREIKFENLQK